MFSRIQTPDNTMFNFLCAINPLISIDIDKYILYTSWALFVIFLLALDLFLTLEDIDHAITMRTEDMNLIIILLRSVNYFFFSFVLPFHYVKN